MTESKNGSKDNLAEPLLEEEKAAETPEKEVAEMEVEEKKDEGKEKKKKEKKVKVPKVKKEPGPSCMDTLSTGLDMAARDGHGINTEINVSPLALRPVPLIISKTTSPLPRPPPSLTAGL